MKLSENDITVLKSAGFQPYEISHLKAGRFDRVSKKKLQLFKKLIHPKKKRSYNKPIIITKKGIKIKPFIQLKPFGGKTNEKEKKSY